MASSNSLPTLNAPRTPPQRPADRPAQTPPVLRGLGLSNTDSPSITTDYDYDIRHGISDSPAKDTLAPSYGDSASSMLSPAFSAGLSPNAAFYTPMAPQTPHTDNGGRLTPSQHREPVRNPFNFTPVQYVAGKDKAAEALGRRKGHKYRHSSIHASAMDSIIQPPMMKTPLAVPAALPIPTRKEVWRSLTSNQTSRMAWCLCHFLIAGYVQFSGEGSLAMTALSRLLLFDAAGATVCVVVDVMGNFEVWKRSSIKHPFGLERADVLAGFGMAVFISFMGLDIISHGIEHSLENVGTHTAHHSHNHTRATMGNIDIASLLAVLSTLISAILLKNHKRIGKATNFSVMAGWGKILGNPSHVLTLSCSALLLILPFLGLQSYKYFDLLVSVFIAGLMVAFGLRLGTSLASMLLMSYKSHDNKNAVRAVIGEIEAEPGVTAVEEAKFWQVHYGLCMANLKLRYRGGDEMAKIRQRVTSLIKQNLGGNWEISTQMTVEGN